MVTATPGLISPIYSLQLHSGDILEQLAGYILACVHSTASQPATALRVFITQISTDHSHIPGSISWDAQLGLCNSVTVTAL